MKRLIFFVLFLISFHVGFSTDWLIEQPMAFFPFAINATDMSGNGITSSNSGATFLNNQAVFADDADVITTTDANAFPTQEDGSISFNFKFLDTYNSSSSFFFVVTSWNTVGAHSGDFAISFRQDTGKLKFDQEDGGALDTTTAEWIGGTLYNVIMTWNNSGKYIYIDGSLNINDSIDDNVFSKDATTKQLVQGWASGVDSNFSIDNLVIFNSSLSPTQVTQLYNNVGSPIAPPPINLTTNILAYWSFDETTEDLTGNGHNLTNNGATNTSGIIEEAFYYDGVNDYMNTSGFNFSGQANISFSVWVNLTLDENNGYIFRKIDDASPVSAPISFNLDNVNIVIPAPGHKWDPRFCYQFNYSQASNCWSDANFYFDFVNITPWIHIVGTLEINSTDYHYKFYKNGAFQSEKTASSGGFFIKDGIGDLEVGAFDFDSFLTNGSIDELALWNRVLNASEVSQLYNSGNGLQYPFLPTDTCTPSAINNNWEIDMTDLCVITDDYELGTGNISFVGASGNATFNANINISNLIGIPVNTILFISTGKTLNVEET